MAATSALESVAASGPVGHHAVMFYEHDVDLVGSVCSFLLPEDAERGRLVVIATPTHLSEIERTMADGSSELDLVGVDAYDALERIVVDGQVDEAAFRALLDEIVSGVDGRRVRAFGEMVAVLWDRGDVAGTIALEDLWNVYIAEHGLSLCCAYPIGAFDDPADTEPFQAVCDRHTHIDTPGRDARPPDRDEEGRLVASLRQQVAAGSQERTELRRQIARLEGTLRHAVDADRLRGEFVAMVAHDIRNPVAVVSGYLDLLADNWAELDHTEAVTFLRMAADNVGRIERLVEDILTMSRIESGEFSCELRPVDIGRIVAETVEQTRQSTHRDIRLVPGHGLRAALVDPDRQVQILNNLLSNAVKYSPEGSIITVGIEDTGDELAVSVHNLGDGIDAADLDDLFRAFWRLERHRNTTPGTGLGLYIAKALVEQQGGSIQARSDEAGTTFTYTVIPATTR